MRISLLKQREPFGSILEKTLGRYWTERYGTSFDVRFCEGQRTHGGGHSPSGPSQTWLCNSLMNAIFLPTRSSAALEPVRREFARSTVAWRRPFQRAYVSLAMSRRFAGWFADSRLQVTPAVPESHSLLIVPGNQKVRLLDHIARTSTCVLKDGFHRDGFDREIKVRLQAANLGLPVPPIHCVQTSWFQEEYVIGTPLNRLGSSEQQARATALGVAALHRLVESTHQSIPVGRYVDGLLDSQNELLNANHRYNENDRTQFRRQARDLRHRLFCRVDPETPISTAMTHGDFQPANLLVENDQIWLIDWENGGRRSCLYDLLVFASQSRSPQGLAHRLMSGDLELPGSPQGTADRTIVNWSRPVEREMYTTVFLIEELNWHLQENINRFFTRDSPGLSQLREELDRWHQLTAESNTKIQPTQSQAIQLC